MLNAGKWILGALFTFIALYLIFFMCYMYFDFTHSNKFLDIQANPLLLWPQFGLLVSFGAVGIGLFLSKRWAVTAYWISIVYWIAISFYGGDVSIESANITSLLVAGVSVVLIGLFLQQLKTKGILR